MPNLFSKCQECLYHNCLSMEHGYNKKYKRDYDKMELLKEYGLPTTVAIKIVELTYTYHKCDYCTDILCTLHKDMSLRYKEAWPYVQCDKCYEKPPIRSRLQPSRMGPM